MYVIHNFFQLWFYHTEVTCAVHGILKIQEVTKHEQFLGHKRLSYENNKKQNSESSIFWFVIWVSGVLVLPLSLVVL